MIQFKGILIYQEDYIKSVKMRKMTKFVDESYNLAT